MGEWQETNKTWHQLQLIYCELCGKVIPRRVWVVEIEGEPKRFCDEGCEELYRTYWLTDGQSSAFGTPGAPSASPQT